MNFGVMAVDVKTGRRVELDGANAERNFAAIGIFTIRRGRCRPCDTCTENPAPTIAGR